MIQGWARDGLTLAQIAHNMGCALGTLCQWKNDYPEINEALKKGKEVVDREVENALFKRTQGYTVELKKTFKVKETLYNENGRKIADKERLEVGIDEQYISPDTTAQIFWLKNRKPEQWRNNPISSGANDEESDNLYQAILEAVKK